MTNIDKPETGSKESVTLFGNRFFISPNYVLLVLYERVRILYERIGKYVNGFRIKYQGNWGDFEKKKIQLFI